MALRLEELVSPELLGASLRIFGDTTAGPIPIFLQENPGDARIGGGSAGPQTIKTLGIDATIKSWMVAAVERLDALLDIDFVFSPTSNGSKINVYLDTEINLGGGGTTLGVALSNEFRRSSWWEVILNGPPLLSDEAYFQFAFIHELGHVLGLEHPFDGSDGDLGGERFGDPDASVTAMSYTRPSTGWPSFYSAADIAALVSIWGLEQDTPAWLIRDASGSEVLLQREQAAERLALLLEGDALLGPAPPAPATPALQTGSEPQLLVISDLADQAEWEVSWDGGQSWQTGSGSTLALADTEPRQVNLRQSDAWGQLSPEFVGVVSPNQVIPVGPDLLLPPQDKANGLRPLLTSPSGDPVLLWGMTADLAADPRLASVIRAAVADLDALVPLDLKEVSQTADGNPAAVSQLLFNTTAKSAKITETALIELEREQELIRVDETALILKDTLEVFFQNGTLANPDTLRRATLEGLGHGLGLQAPPAGLLTSTSVMVPVESTSSNTHAAELTTLDRSALISLHGTEQNGGDHSELTNLNTNAAVVHFGQLAVRFRTEASGQEITILELPVVRSGNMAWSVPLGWQAGELKAALLLEPGQQDGLLQLALPSGMQQELELQALLPMQAELGEGSSSTLKINLHALEFGLTTTELLDQQRSEEFNAWGSGPIGWNLSPELESSWGSRLRTILQTLDDACGLEFIEVENLNPLLQWQFVSGSSAERNPKSTNMREALFVLGPDPSTPATEKIGSEEQQLLQAILLKLGLEHPEQESDGDAYRRTPVFPEESALFNAIHSFSSQQATLKELDAMALVQLHGSPSPQQLQDNNSPPTLDLALVREQSGIRLTGNGAQKVLRLAISRSGDLSGNNQVLLSEARLGLAEEISLSPGEERVELTVPLQPGTAEALSFRLEILSGGYDPVGSSLQLNSDAAELTALTLQPARDPITAWRPDLDGDGYLNAEVEGKLLARFAFGTFPGDQLTAELDWPNGTNGIEAQADQWLSMGLQTGLAPGNLGQIMQILHILGPETYSAG